MSARVADRFELDEMHVADLLEFFWSLYGTFRLDQDSRARACYKVCSEDTVDVFQRN